MVASPDIDEVKVRLKSMWMAGDYAHFAQYLEPGALEFLRGTGIGSGDEVLDVGYGAGQLSLPRARLGAAVVGIDIATNLIEQAQARAQAEKVHVRFEEGDAEALDFAKRLYPVRYPFPPAEVVEFFRLYYGPTNRAFAALQADADKQSGLRRDLEDHWSKHNSAPDGETTVAAEYLEVIAIKA